MFSVINEKEVWNWKGGGGLRGGVSIQKEPFRKGLYRFSSKREFSFRKKIVFFGIKRSSLDIGEGFITDF